MEELLLAWFIDHGRDLPWRKTREPYPILVSEVMLQQTQVERVVPRYLSWLERWPTVEALKKVRPATLETFFHAHHSVPRETIACRMAAIKEAVPLTTDQAVMHASVLMINA